WPLGVETLAHHARRGIPLSAVRLFLEMTRRHPGPAEVLRIADDGRDDEPVHAIRIFEEIEVLRDAGLGAERNAVLSQIPRTDARGRDFERAAVGAGTRTKAEWNRAACGPPRRPFPSRDRRALPRRLAC